MANIRSTFYTGVTNDLIRRVYEHKNDVVEGFTKRYRLHLLVYYESFESIEQAIVREKQIKDLNRAEKLKIIREFNPTFEDLYDRIST